MLTRILTGLVLAPLLIVLVVWGPAWALFGLLVLVAARCADELVRMYPEARLLDRVAVAALVALWAASPLVGATALATLRHNAAHTRLTERLEVIAGDALAGLAALAGRQFDYVYVDPPYDAGLHAPLLAGLVRHQLLAPSAQVLVESRRGLVGLDGWRVVLERRYGSSVLQRLEPA